MRKKILIIEDDSDFRMVEKAILEEMDYEVIEASSAKDGIDRATRESPDLILMDIRLPYKRRGIGTARLLRNSDKAAHIPIIFVTGYTQGEYANEVRHISNCGYITKPFERHIFEKKIRDCISSGRAD